MKSLSTTAKTDKVRIKTINATKLKNSDFVPRMGFVSEVRVKRSSKGTRVVVTFRNGKIRMYLGSVDIIAR